jgi:hypothetical protein
VLNWDVIGDVRFDNTSSNVWSKHLTLQKDRTLEKTDFGGWIGGYCIICISVSGLEIQCAEVNAKIYLSLSVQPVPFF